MPGTNLQLKSKLSKAVNSDGGDGGGRRRICAAAAAATTSSGSYGLEFDELLVPATKLCRDKSSHMTTSNSTNKLNRAVVKTLNKTQITKT